MLKPKTQSTTDRSILEIQFFQHRLTFLISPTWEINPESSDLNQSDFAIGCLDFLAGLDLQYNCIMEYRNGFEAIEKLADLTNHANCFSQFPSN